MKKKNENRILYFDQSDSSELVKRKTNEGGRWSNQKTERIIYAEMRAVFELENTVEYTQHNNIVVHDNNNIILYRIVILLHRSSSRLSCSFCSSPTFVVVHTVPGYLDCVHGNDNRELYFGIYRNKTDGRRARFVTV